LAETLRVAIGGGLKAGKSTLVNALERRDTRWNWLRGNRVVRARLRHTYGHAAAAAEGCPRPQHLVAM
jgi:nicotinamide riboside kinase